MGRLIDADALIAEMKKEQESGKYDKNTIIVADCFIGILNRQPTAFDIEKVVAELEEMKKECKILQKTTTDAYGYMKMRHGITATIDVVRKGGIA